jgi:hypothetical protein
VAVWGKLYLFFDSVNVAKAKSIANVWKLAGVDGWIADVQKFCHAKIQPYFLQSSQAIFAKLFDEE